MDRKRPHPWEEQLAKTGRLFVYASELTSAPDDGDDSDDGEENRGTD